MRSIAGLASMVGVSPSHPQTPEGYRETSPHTSLLLREDSVGLQDGSGSWNDRVQLLTPSWTMSKHGALTLRGSRYLQYA